MHSDSTNYNIYPTLILRTPFFSYLDYSFDALNNILKNDFFQVALYLANPYLFHILAAKDFNLAFLETKILLSLSKYYNRMSFRPTPFGGFSIFTITQWGDFEQLIVERQVDSIIKLKIDNELSIKIGLALSPYFGAEICYYSNPTLYKLKRSFRYIKSLRNPENYKLSFSLESFESDTVISSLLKYLSRRKEKQPDILAWIMSKTGYSEEEASEYLSLLKTTQILKSDSDPNITGEDYLDRLLGFNNVKEITLAKTLRRLNKQISSMQYPTLPMLQDINKKLDEVSDHYGIKKPRTNFYSNTMRPVIAGGINYKYQNKITEAIEALKHIVPSTQSQTIAGFIKDFKNRFDKQKIQLLQALDPDAGVGYGNLMTAFQEPILLDQIDFANIGKDTFEVEWSPVHRLLLKKWNIMNKNGDEAIVIDNMDILDLKLSDTLLLPPSICVLFRLVNDKLIITSAGGASGASLIGRFTPLSSEILKISHDLAKTEERSNPDVIFAEIGQLSDASADNINRRSSVYSYEIPINAHSEFSIDKQIALSDLYVSVIDDQIILESSVLKKVVIPRHSSAFNYANSELAVFRFLCDLQHQGLQANLSFDLEHFFPGMSYYPRVVFSETVIAEAKWRFDKEMNIPVGLSSEQACIRLTEIRKKHAVPDLICLVKSDQQLVFNLEKKHDLLFFFKSIKGEEKVSLKEYLLPDPVASTVVDVERKPYTNEFISFLYKETPVYTTKFIKNVAYKAKTEKAFLLGSKWLYLKIYCTPTTANELLIGKILPLIRKTSKDEPLIWFFIRYNDSGFHIRLRIKVKEYYVGKIIAQFKDSFLDTFNYHIIKEYQAETYQRELERYGADLIERVEDFFHRSSNLLLQFLYKNTGDTYNEHSIAIVSVNEMLNIFIPDIAEQLSFLKQMSDSFYKEFSADKTLNVSLDLKYRGLKKEFESLISNKKFYTSLQLSKYQKSFIKALKDLANSFKKNQDYRKNQMLADLIHMHLNRVFISHQRKQELIIYHCFYKLKLSHKARFNSPH